MQLLLYPREDSALEISPRLAHGDVSLGVAGRIGHDTFFLSFLALAHVFRHNNPEE